MYMTIFERVSRLERLVKDHGRKLCCVSGAPNIDIQNQGVSIGPFSDLNTINFTGPGVTASVVGGILTVNVPGGGGITNASNGLSIDGTGAVVLGQDEGDGVNPAVLTSDREIPTNGFYITFTEITPFNTVVSTRIRPALLELEGSIGEGRIPGIFIRDIQSGNAFEISQFSSGGGYALALQSIGAPIVSNIIQLGDYPNARNDSGLHTPISFLYTDTLGGLRSAPITSLFPSSAIEGLSFDPNLEKIRLGQAPLTAGDPAAITGEAEIPVNNLGITYIDRPSGDNIRYSSDSILITDGTNGGILSILKNNINYFTTTPTYQSFNVDPFTINILDGATGNNVGMTIVGPNMGIAVVSGNGDPTNYPEVTIEKQDAGVPYPGTIKMETKGTLTIGLAGAAVPLQHLYFDLINQRLGVFEPAPTHGLDISSTLRIRSGSPGAGKILTSDIDGVATWETPSTGITAISGTSVNGTGDVVLGQDVGDPANPAALTSDRQIPIDGFGVEYIVLASGDKLRIGDIGGPLEFAYTTGDGEFDAGIGKYVFGIGNITNAHTLALVIQNYPTLELNRSGAGGDVEVGQRFQGVVNIGTKPTIGNTNPPQAAYFDAVNLRLGVNEPAPSHTLDVNGQVRIRGGSPGVGKILTSDINGVATWQTPDSAIGYKGGQSVFTADGTTTVFDIVHNLGATPSFFSLTTTEPIANNHLARTITFPDVNTLRITFNSAPNVGENANYVWIVYK